MIEIRFARLEDKPAVINFLKKHWSEKSILVTSETIFDFQYVFDGKLGFVLAIDDETGEIFGLKGYFPFNSLEKPDVAAALAIVLQGVRPMLGMEIERFLEKETNSRWLCSTGLNPNTSVRIYQLFKKQYVVDKLNHYYRLGTRTDFAIAQISEPKRLPIDSAEDACELVALDTLAEYQEAFDATRFMHQKPYKDDAYIEKRYYKHPVYQYRLLGLKNPESNVADAVMITRVIEINGSKVLRVLDYLGDRKLIALAGPAIDALLNEENFEYIDFYCYGFDHEALSEAGMSLKTEDDPNIIPNYFEPYEAKNVDIWFFSTGAEDAALCKADGDQDRPNIVPEGL